MSESISSNNYSYLSNNYFNYLIVSYPTCFSKNIEHFSTINIDNAMKYLSSKHSSSLFLSQSSKYIPLDYNPDQKQQNPSRSSENKFVFGEQASAVHQYFDKQIL